MSGQIIILEDTRERAEAMRKCVARRFPQVQCIIFDSAPDVISWLKTSLRSVSIMSLDHDLEVAWPKDIRASDPGTGRDVVDFLLSYEPTCPIIIHTSNATAGDAMQYELEAAGWITCRILPFGESWIENEWCEKIGELLGLD
ncbi:MAG: cyclic-phosphate processing receiver domain-containing protein [Planctomycetota bacterium]|jgi:hypothetical protein